MNRLTVRVVLLAVLAAGSHPAAEPSRPALVGIDHVLFKVSDLAGAGHFYGDVLGLAATPAPTQASGHDARTFAVNARQRVVIAGSLAAGDDERLGHIAFSTANLQALGEYLRARGIAVDGPARRADCGAESLRTVDAEGHAIEFVAEAPPTAFEASDRAVSDRLLHAGITVRDQAAENALYRDVLGMSEIWRGGFSTLKANWVNLRLPESADYLEYMLRDGPSTRRQLGVDHHICLVVPSIEAAWQTIRARTPADQQAQLSPPQIGRNEKWQVNLYDPDGTRVELMEPYNVR